MAVRFLHVGTSTYNAGTGVGTVKPCICKALRWVVPTFLRYYAKYSYMHAHIHEDVYICRNVGISI